MGVRTLNPASLPNPIWGVADAGVATQHGVVTIRTATALPETEGVETDPTRMVDYCRQALASLGQTIKAQHAFAMAADGDHYLLTFNAPVNVEDVYVRLELHLPADARQRLPRCSWPDTRTNWHLYPYNVICRLHAHLQRDASRLNETTWGSVGV